MICWIISWIGQEKLVKYIMINTIEWNCSRFVFSFSWIWSPSLVVPFWLHIGLIWSQIILLAHIFIVTSSLCLFEWLAAFDLDFVTANIYTKTKSRPLSKYYIIYCLKVLLVQKFWTHIFLHKFTLRFACIQILSTTLHCLLQVHKYALQQIYYNNRSKNVSVSVF